MPAELTGLRIVITRPRHQAAAFGSALESLGAEVIYLPVIEIAPPDNLEPFDRALTNLAAYDWVIFTSVNGVEMSLERREYLGLQSWPHDLQVAAIGPKTAAALQADGIQVDFTPEEYIAEAIPPGLGRMAGKRFLLLRADLARPALAEMIAGGGGQVDEITAYRTIPAKPDPMALAAITAGVDILTFTSSSTVRNFWAILDQAGFAPARLPGAPKIACIGPVTASTARDLGMQVDLVAETYTIEGLIAALKKAPTDHSVH